MTASTTLDLRVAICVCTHNRSQSLSQLLLTMEGIDLSGYNPKLVELIVIDNNPSPETEAICQRSAPKLPIAIHYTTESAAGITYARNHAIGVALERAAEYISFIDDDDQPQPDWLIQLLDRQAITRADLVFGTWILNTEMPQWAKKSGISRSPVKARKKKKNRRYGLPGCASTCNVLIGRDILERVGANGEIFSHRFRNSGGEDKDFFIRAQALGAQLESADMSVIKRIHEQQRYTIRGVLKRGFKSGCSQTAMARTHGTRKRLFRLLAVALLKLCISLLLMPFTIFSRGFFMHNLSRIARAVGIWYTVFTGYSLKYYPR